jgi:outer membrane protein TolC
MKKWTLINWRLWRRKIIQSIILGISIIAFISIPSYSQAEKAKLFNHLDIKSNLPLSLKECIYIALKNNLDIKVEGFNPEICEKEIIKEKSEFDPIFSFKVNNRKSVTDGTSLLSGAGEVWWLKKHLGWEDKLKLESLDFNAGISKKMFAGGECRLELTNNRFESNSFFQYYDRTYQSNLIFSIHQPLLKGFGVDINKSKIKVANNNKTISQSRFKQKVMDVISDVQKKYWDLFFFIENLNVKKESFNLAQDLLERNKALVEAGRLAPVEILQAQVGLASREEEVLIAKNAMKDAEDKLRQVLNLMDTWGKDEKTIIPKDTPVFCEQQVSLLETIEAAIKNRPEYKQAQTDLENKRLALKVARNQMLPMLNFEGSYGLNGIADSYHGGIDELSTGDDYSWHVGINFQFPLGNRKAKSDYLEKKLEVKKAEAFLDQVKKKL